MGKLTPVTVNLKSYTGEEQVHMMKGTLLWKWRDDEGNLHTFKLPNSYYDPKGSRFLSPQHWAKEMKKSSKYKKKTICYQGDDESITLCWENHKATCRYKTEGVADITLYVDQVVLQANEQVHEGKHPSNTLSTLKKTLEYQDTNQSRLYKDDDDMFPEQEKIMQALKKLPTEMKHHRSSTLLHHHERMGHISFKRLRLMAKKGIISRKFLGQKDPKCQACLMAKATRRRWRTNSKKPKVKDINQDLTPGQVVSVDQLTTETPGYVAQMTGIPTKQRYTSATIYVDQATRYTYVHLQYSTTAAETVEGKQKFELHMASMGHKVLHYHADNGIFAANQWLNDCQTKGQGISFAGVGAHHQNGVAERKIRDLQDLSRSMMLHAVRQWPNAITVNLWPYAIRMACDATNNAPLTTSKTEMSPLQLTTNADININWTHWHTFGAPVYNLLPHLQQEPRIHDKWKPRTKDYPGIYLGHSPVHARTVGLVLDPKTNLTTISHSDSC